MRVLGGSGHLRLPGSDAMLMGSNTYDYFAPRWSSPSGPYLERLYEMRKYVFSSTLTAADWTQFIRRV